MSFELIGPCKVPRSPYFVPGLPHVVLIELRRVLFNRTSIAAWYPYRVEKGPYLVPGMSHGILVELRRALYKRIRIVTWYPYRVEAGPLYNRTRITTCLFCCSNTLAGRQGGQHHRPRPRPGLQPRARAAAPRAQVSISTRILG